MPTNLQMNFTNSRKTMYTSSVKTATKLPIIGARPPPRQVTTFVNTNKSSGGGGCGCSRGGR